MAELKAEGIGSQVHYIPIYRQPFYVNHFHLSKNNFPECEAYYESSLSLPIYPAMTLGQQLRVVRAVQKICGPS